MNQKYSLIQQNTILRGNNKYNQIDKRPKINLNKSPYDDFIPTIQKNPSSLKLWQNKMLPPTYHREVKTQHLQPDVDLKLLYAYGYRTKDQRNNIIVTSK